MVPQPEDGRFSIMTEVTANSFENGQPIMETVSEDMDIGLIPGNQFPIQPDLFHLLHHRQIPPGIKLNEATASPA
jgi:hypothetical protein